MRSLSALSGMHTYSNLLVVVGSLCLLITLVLAWCLVGVRSSAFMKVAAGAAIIAAVARGTRRRRREAALNAL